MGENILNEENLKKTTLTRNLLTNDSLSKNKVDTNEFYLIMGVNSLTIIIAFSIIISFVLLIILCYAIKLLRRKSRKEAELKTLTPMQYSYPRLAAGIRADQQIEFVVPTITMSGSTPFSLTEDSMSDSEYFGITSGSDREYGTRSRHSSMRQRHPAGDRYHISPSDISKQLYPESEEIKQPTESKLNFILHYSFHREQLLVTLLSAINLPLTAGRTKISPYAKIILLPEKTPKFLTKVQKNNCNPTFNELFIFPAKRSTLDNRKLKISIWDYDRFSRKTFIGRTFYPLSESKISSLITNDVITDEIWCTLIEGKEKQKNGEILLSLCYQTNSQTLTLNILKLRYINVRDTSSVYVKIELFLRKKRIRHRKTQSKTAQSEIEFDEQFHVNIAKDSLSDIEICLTVNGRSLSTFSKRSFGKIYLGESCSVNQGVQHWFDMMQGLDSTVIQSHRLF